MNRQTEDAMYAEYTHARENGDYSTSLDVALAAVDARKEGSAVMDRFNEDRRNGR